WRISSARIERRHAANYHRHSGMVRKHQTSDAQLRIGESRDSWFDASPPPGMTPSASLPGLHLRPQPVDDPLRRRIAGGDDEQFLLRRLVRIDVLVVEDLWVNRLS